MRPSAWFTRTCSKYSDNSISPPVSCNRFCRKDAVWNGPPLFASSSDTHVLPVGVDHILNGGGPPGSPATGEQSRKGGKISGRIGYRSNNFPATSRSEHPTHMGISHRRDARVLDSGVQQPQIRQASNQPSRGIRVSVKYSRGFAGRPHSSHDAIHARRAGGVRP